MYEGDYSRKRTLVEYGFRLPSAVDNRPLKFAEFERCLNQVVYVSATPGTHELTHAGADAIEQIVRPTGLMDPPIDVVRRRDRSIICLVRFVRKSPRAAGCWSRRSRNGWRKI